MCSDQSINPGVGSRVVLLKVHPYYAQKSTVLMKKSTLLSFLALTNVNSRQWEGTR